MTESTLTKTHVTQLRKVMYALRSRTKMNTEATRLVLGEENQKAMDVAIDSIRDAIYTLQKIK